MSHPLLKTWQKMSVMPAGKMLFSKAVCFKAPYFASIGPRFNVLEKDYAEVQIKNSRKVHNHIGTVHAIAMCNMAELSGGTMTEVSIPRSMRWIPKGMTVEYLKKAQTPMLRAQARPTTTITEGEKQDYPVQVEVKDSDDQVVFRAMINMYLSPK